MSVRGIDCVRIARVPEHPLILLASNSPRRRALLSLTGWTFEVAPAHVDERPRAGEKPADYVVRLARTKALALAGRAAHRDRVILAADTTVVEAGDILGKPRDADEATAMLRRLRGRVHQVYTALALLRPRENGLLTDLCVSDVTMRHYSDEEIEAYVRSGDPLDKAGAYAIQHPLFRPVERLEGCFAGVMGLPLCHLRRAMRSFGLTPPNDVAATCQEALQVTCPIAHVVLASNTQQPFEGIE
ncbi:MAG: septum formation protein Maf [Anaerolineae bacterium]|nr:MAG: septum formation protein Maf [Anaerolineae bacterium]